MADVAKARKKRAVRIRSKLAKVNNGRPRLCVFRSSKNISAQIIDDKEGKTIASASSLDASLKGKLSGSKVDIASAIGKEIADRAVKAGVKDVVFDRGGYIFHGRVKALAEAAREAGLNL